MIPAASDLRIGVPAYFAPDVDADGWRELGLLRSGAVVVVNPDTGPTPGMRGTYRPGVREVRGGGTLVYGYVDTAYGGRSGGAILRDGLAYRLQLGLDGVFLDQASPTRQEVRRLARLARIFRLAGLRVAINPGRADIDPRAFRRFDEVVTFEGPWSAYLHDGDALGEEPAGRARRWHLVYAVPDVNVPTVLAVAHRRRAALVYVTALTMPNPWCALSARFGDIVRTTSDEGAPTANHALRPLAIRGR